MDGKQRRRTFSPEYKLERVREVLDGPESTAAVARRYQLNDNLLFKWVGEYRSNALWVARATQFLPVEVVDKPVAVSKQSIASTGQDNCRGISATLAIDCPGCPDSSINDRLNSTEYRRRPKVSAGKSSLCIWVSTLSQRGHPSLLRVTTRLGARRINTLEGLPRVC